MPTVLPCVLRTVQYCIASYNAYSTALPTRLRPRSNRIGVFGIGFNTAVGSMSNKVCLESLVANGNMVHELSYDMVRA